AESAAPDTILTSRSSSPKSVESAVASVFERSRLATVTCVLRSPRAPKMKPNARMKANGPTNDQKTVPRSRNMSRKSLRATSEIALHLLTDMVSPGEGEAEHAEHRGPDPRADDPMRVLTEALSMHERVHHARAGAADRRRRREWAHACRVNLDRREAA